MIKKEKPILTVLLVTYNHETSVSTAIDSILEQKTSHPYVIWILEDSSTDNTLKICKDYASRYPKLIKLISQPENTKGQHLLQARRKLNTKYFTMLEGDDSWCHKDKIQLAVDTLEKNPEYVMFAHDTLFNYLETGEQRSLVHDIHKVRLKNPVTFDDNPPLLHNSSRVYRHVLDFNKNPAMLDTLTFYSFLDKGPLYYHDEIMSVYNYTGEGMWSKLSPKQQAITTDKAYYNCLKALDYRHDDFFTNKISRPKKLKKIKRLIGKKLGWKIYILKSMLISRISLRLS
jgi:glycosyltransferase involved in cell wall biosynthesis